MNASEAAALVKNPQSSVQDFLGPEGSGNAQLGDSTRVQAALADAGVTEEETQIIAGGDQGKADQVVRKTLFNVAPTMPPQNNETDRPSTTRLRRPSRILENDRYSIKREFARGGQGRIMIARDNIVGREVALKELLPELQETADQGTPATAGADTIGVVERFLREAKVTGQLEHPNVVPVYEIGRRENGSLYYTMKFVRGQTMAERLRDIDRLSQLTRDKRLALRLKLLQAFQGICNAVAFSHSRGVIHRDLKPQNIMVGDFGETVLLDWGLARVKGQDDKIGKQLTLVATNMLSESLLRQNADGLTLDGTVFGTPHYMPPEQARADLTQIDEQSDVYSLGAILYEILTGAPPYDGPTAGAILQQVMSGPPRKVKEREPGAPPELIALCEFAMAHDKGRRLKTALQMAQEVQSYRDGGKVSVYRYGTFENARRTIARHRGAFLAAALSFWMLLGGAALFFLVIIDEKHQSEKLKQAADSDRDATSEAFAKAQRARQAQQVLKQNQADDFRAQRKAREGEIKSLRETIAGMRVEPLIKELAARVAEHEDLENRGRAMESTPAARANTANLLMSVLGYATAQESLISLLALGGAEETGDSMERLDLEKQRRTLADVRLLAARLATYNSDFAQAELWLAGTVIDEASHRQARAALARSRDALLKVQFEQISGALADVDAGLERIDRPAGSPTLTQYVSRLSGCRERQTVELLGRALAPLAQRAKSADAIWTQTDFDKVTLICRVLGALELPLETPAPLLVFLAANPPAPLAIECALALCRTRSPGCALPLIELARARDGYIWSRIEAHFAQVPLPAQMLQSDATQDLVARAIASLARGQIDSAIADSTRAVNADEDSAIARLVRGRAYLQNGELNKAHIDLTRAMTLDPGSAAPCISRGDLMLKRGEISLAIIDYSQAISRDKSSATALVRRGLARMEAFEFEAAAADFSRAVGLDQWRTDALIARGRAHEAIRDPVAADADYTAALATDPYFAEGWTRRGMLRRSLGDQARALTDLTRAIELNPTDARNFSTRAQSQFVQGRWAQAVNDATAALELDANDVDARLYRAWTYLRLTDSTTVSLDRAVSDLKRLTEIVPTDHRVWLTLGDTLFLLKRYDECATAMGTARKLTPFGAHQQGAQAEAIYDMELDAQAALLVEKNVTDFESCLLKARGLINRTSGANTASSIADWRMAKTLYLAALKDWQQDLSLAGHRTPLLISTGRRLRNSLLDSRYFADAGEIGKSVLAASRFDTREDAFAAARAAAQLSDQYHMAGVLFLGENPADAERLQLEARNLTGQARQKVAEEQQSLAFEMLKLAVDAGFSDFERAGKEPDLVVLHSDSQWAGLMQKMSGAASDPARTAKLKSIEPMPVVFAAALIPGGQGLARKILRRDVVVRVAENDVSNLVELKAALTAQKRPFKLTLRRYEFDQAGHFVQRVDAAGKPLTDELSRPIWAFEEVQVEVAPGILGVQMEEGVVPRFRSVP